MTTGKQLAGLLLLTTALTFPGIVHAQNAESEQTEAGDAGASLDQVDGAPVGEDDQYEQPEISVPGGNSIIVTGRINRDPTRNSTQVISVLSSEEIARTGEGDIAGALGRVTGLSVVGNGLVYVRGLGDRYSLALLNGLPLPSPEPLSRVVPLDIFPTNVVASSLVQKTYSPNYPGEFGGGVINLTTRAIPDESFVSISAGLSGDTETTFQNGYAYYGSEMDWTGFDTGARDLPGSLQGFLSASQNDGLLIDSLDQASVEAIASGLTPSQFSTLQQIGDLRPNFSFGLTAGTAFDIGGDGRLGVLFTSSLSNKWRNRVISRQEAGPNSTAVDRDETQFNTDNSMLFNALLGFGLEVGDHTIRWTNLFIRDTVKQASLSSYTLPFEFESFDFLEQNTGWYERQLMDTQIVGEFDFGRLSVDVRGGYARTDREAPYNLTYVYGRDTNPNAQAPWRNEYLVDLGQSIGSGFQETGIDVSFSDLQEELWFGGLDLSYEVTDTLSATVGYAYSDTHRYSERRSFTFDVNVDPDFYVTDPDVEGSGIPANGITSLQQLLEITGLRSPWLLLNSATYNLFDVGLIDNDFQDPAFTADLTVHAGYGQAQWVPTDTLTLQGGVRFETAEQTTTPVGALSEGLPVTSKNDYWLPGVTLTYEPMDDLQLRVSASKTIARPQFRELVRQRYFDPETNRAYSGNPYLTDSELTNFEARAEYYLGGPSRISVAGFYKDIQDPIEVYVGLTAGSRFISYANAPKATLYGGELEFQYFHDLYNLGGWFESKQLVLVTNYTYTSSELSVSDSDTVDVVIGQNRNPNAQASQYFTDGSPLVGQSDHIVNVQLGLEDVDSLQQFTVLFSYASERVALRGSNGLSDVIEKPGVTLDLVARQGLNIGGTEAEFKLEARNLLGTDHQEYQTNATGLRIENNSYDIGQSFSASVSVKF